MSDLIGFLRARLDEKAAEAVEQAKELDRWFREDVENGPGTCGCQGCIVVAGTLCDEDDQPRPPLHPDRVLAEIAAKRQIIDCLDRLPIPDIDDEHAQGGESALVWVCRVLAQVDAEHPDFDPAWRVD